MKIQIYILTSFLLVSGISLGQKSDLKRVDKLFEMRAYNEAAEIYETKERTQQVLQNLADSYYYNANLQKAVKTYRELFIAYGGSMELDYYFRYGQALKGIQNYDEADKYLNRYYNKNLNTAAFIEKNTKMTPHNFSLKQVEMENSHSDFGLSFYGEDKVVFASTRNIKSPNYAWNDLPYLDLYLANITSNDILENIVPFSEVINTRSHESNAVFTKDGKTMYFNRTNSSRKKVGEDKIAHVKIYKAELVGDQWTNVIALPFASDSYSTVHPALSQDESTLYFASDRPGTLGSFDIFKVAINMDGTYGEPENLGSNINTEHREQFPFISEDDVLYFSSIGHEGFGGLDVFRSDMVNGTFDNPINLGSTINSGLDDFAFVIKEQENKGFLSSNRSGFDRLYGFKRNENPLTKYQVAGLIQDKNSKSLLAGASLTLLDEAGHVIQDTVVGEKAAYLFKIEPNKKYKIVGVHKGYVAQEIEFSTNNQEKVLISINLSLESFADADARVRKDEKGDLMVDLDKIYFDYNASKISADAAATLNVLVDLMKKYPSMKIEIASHTDARGNDRYNLELSKLRAASALEYLVSQGIARNRLTSVGYGETQPLNNCTKEGMCKEEEYDINRRCEFKILN